MFLTSNYLDITDIIANFRLHHCEWIDIIAILFIVILITSRKHYIIFTVFELLNCRILMLAMVNYPNLRSVKIGDQSEENSANFVKPKTCDGMSSAYQEISMSEY